MLITKVIYCSVLRIHRLFHLNVSTIWVTSWNGDKLSSLFGCYFFQINPSNFLRLLVLSIKNHKQVVFAQLVLLLCPYRKNISTWPWQLFLLAFVCPGTLDIKSFQMLLPTGSRWQKSWKPLPTLVYYIRLFPSNFKLS